MLFQPIVVDVLHWPVVASVFFLRYDVTFAEPMHHNKPNIPCISVLCGAIIHISLALTAAGSAFEAAFSMHHDLWNALFDGVPKGHLFTHRPVLYEYSQTQLCSHFRYGWHCIIYGRIVCWKQVYMVCINNWMSQNTMGCNYISMP